MTLIVWPNIDFAPGDTGRRQWLKDMASQVLATADQIADGLPFGDLTGVDLSNPPSSGRALLVYDPVDGTVELGTDADPGSGYISATEKGVPLGVATLDADGNLVEPVVGGGGTGGHVILDDAEAPVTARPNLQFVGFTLEDDAADEITRVISPVPTARDYVLAANVTDTSGVTTLASLPFLDDDGNPPTLEANAEYRVDVYIDYAAATDADYRIVPTLPGTPAWVRGAWDGPQAASTDTAGSRRRPSGLTTGTPQHFGGYGASTPATLWGNFRIKTGGTGGALAFQFTKSFAVASIATTYEGSWIDLARVR